MLEYDYESHEYVGTWRDVNEVTQAFIDRSNESDVWGVYTISETETTHRLLYHRSRWNKSQRNYTHEFVWSEDRKTYSDPEIEEVFHSEIRES